MKDNRKKDLGLIYQKKAEVIKEALEDSIGIFVRLKDGFIKLARCKKFFAVSGDLSRSNVFSIMGITNSENVALEVERIVNSIKTVTTRIFSFRDVNFQMIIHGLAEEIEYNFYDPENEKPFPVELIAFNSSPDFEEVLTISYNGEIDTLDEEVKVIIYGCTDETKVKNLRDFINSQDLTEETMDQFTERIGPELEKFCAGSISEKIKIPFEDKSEDESK